jgi:hypothetical protein
LRLAFAISTGFLIVSALPVRAGGDGFSGKWILDRRSPRPGDAPNNLETRIKQDGSGVTIESTFKEPDNAVVPLLYLGVMTTKLHLGTGGREEQNQIGPFQMALKTTMNGNQMLTDWTAEMQGDQVQGHWTHTLSDDGKHMTLEIKEDSPQGRTHQATLYFVRK